MTRIALYAFAVIGVLSCLAAFGVWALGSVLAGGIDEPSIEKMIESPDDTHFALQVANSGGGAAGWCRQFVVIRAPIAWRPQQRPQGQTRFNLLFLSRRFS